MHGGDDWPETDALGSSANELAPGAIFAGRYRLEAEIGRGGFGAVHRAVELAVQRPVALKILRSDRLEPNERMRFRREAELARRLTHPNVVRLYEFGEDAHGTPYIEYELLEGRTLAHALRSDGALDAERALCIAAPILKALMEAHGLGIVHRDIKPANVMLCDFAGEPDFVKVLDFGIARAVDNTVTRLTETGTVLGTPRYMAPEQIRGQTPTASMDVYAVGMTLAEMIAGEPVYRGAPMDVCLAVLSNDPVPLPERVRQSALGAVVARAVQKDPLARYASAAEMLQELEGAPLNDPQLAHSKAPAPARSAWWLLAGMAAAVLVVGGMALAAVVMIGASDSSLVEPEQPLWLDADAVAARMQARGWQNVSIERSEKEIRVKGQRADQHATVLRMTGKSEAAAELLVSLQSKQGFATLRDGKALVAARVQTIGAGTDAAASRALLSELR